MRKLKDYKTKRALKKKISELEEDVRYFKNCISELEDTLSTINSDLEWHKRKYEKSSGGNTYQEDIKEAV